MLLKKEYHGEAKKKSSLSFLGKELPFSWKKKTFFCFVYFVFFCSNLILFCFTSDRSKQKQNTILQQGNWRFTFEIDKLDLRFSKPLCIKKQKLGKKKTENINKKWKETAEKFPSKSRKIELSCCKNMKILAGWKNKTIQKPEFFPKKFPESKK